MSRPTLYTCLPDWLNCHWEKKILSPIIHSRVNSSSMFFQQERIFDVISRYFKFPDTIGNTSILWKHKEESSPPPPPLLRLYSPLPSHQYLRHRSRPVRFFFFFFFFFVWKFDESTEEVEESLKSLNMRRMRGPAPPALTASTSRNRVS